MAIKEIATVRDRRPARNDTAIVGSASYLESWRGLAAFLRRGRKRVVMTAQPNLKASSYAAIGMRASSAKPNSQDAACCA